MYAAIQKATEENRAVSADTIRLFEKLNPHYYKTYQALGDYYRNQMNCEQAALYYRKALQKEINNQANRSVIQERLASCHK
jgi:Tfp pilus assembly protein PilF